MSEREEQHRRWLAARAAERFVGPPEPSPQERAQWEWERRDTRVSKALD
jgi:hypothetical protein